MGKAKIKWYIIKGYINRVTTEFYLIINFSLDMLHGCKILSTLIRALLEFSYLVSIYNKCTNFSNFIATQSLKISVSHQLMVTTMKPVNQDT